MSGAGLGWRGQKNPWNGFQTVDSRQHNTVIPEKQNEGSPTIVPAHYQERVSRPQHRNVEPGRGPVVSLTWEGRAKSLGRPRRLEFPERSTRKKKSVLLKRELRRSAEGPLSHQRCLPHACEETVEAEERTGKKGASRTILRAHTRGDSPCSHQPEC